MSRMRANPRTDYHDCEKLSANLIVGLGNPGQKYHGTRHNVGFQVVDEVARRRSLEFETAPAEAVMAVTRGETNKLILAKPMTFMNLSGQAVASLHRYYKVALEDVMVVAEDVHLPLGRLRIRGYGSDGGHNGFKSVIEVLGTQKVPRLRVGVGRGDERKDLSAHVLSKFESNEKEAIAIAINRAADAIGLFLEDGLNATMNRYNGPELESEESVDSELDENTNDAQNKPRRSE